MILAWTHASQAVCVALELSAISALPLISGVAAPAPPTISPFRASLPPPSASLSLCAPFSVSLATFLVGQVQS